MRRTGKIGIILVMVLGVAWVASGCVSMTDYRNMQKKYEADLKASNELRESLAAQKDQLEQDNLNLKKDLALTKIEMERLQKDYQAIEKANKDLLHTPIFGDIIGVTETEPGKGEIGEALLFAPGKDELKESGKKILAQVAEVLQKKEGLVRIEGYTDNDPINKTKDRWTTESNFELAAYRALTVLLYLEKEGGVDPARMYLCSFGEYHSKVPNTSAENKAKNRRVVIALTPIQPKEPTKEKEPAPGEEMHK